MAAFLVFLLLILTFNAYACILPLQTVTHMDCSSDAEDEARQTCDAFLEIGPQSQLFTKHDPSPFTCEWAVPTRLPDAFISVFKPTSPPHNIDTPIHLSIPTTVLRI